MNETVAANSRPYSQKQDKTGQVPLAGSSCLKKRPLSLKSQEKLKTFAALKISVLLIVTCKGSLSRGMVYSESTTSPFMQNHLIFISPWQYCSDA